MWNMLQSEEDRAFIRAILSMPGDVAPRLVYADWLDEQDTEESRRAAEFLRLLVQLTQTPTNSPRMLVIKNTLRQLEKRLPFLWVVTLDVPLIEACAEQFQFVCPKQWDQLQLTDAAKVRHCEHCDKDVHFSKTLTEAARHALAGHCVALPTSTLRKDKDLDSAIRRQRIDQFDGRVLMGRIAPARNLKQSEE